MTRSITNFEKKSQNPEFKLAPQEAEFFLQMKR